MNSCTNFTSHFNANYFTVSLSMFFTYLFFSFVIILSVLFVYTFFITFFVFLLCRFVSFFKLLVILC